MDRTEGSKRILSILTDKSITEWRDVLVRMMDECRRQIEEIERAGFDNITHILVWLGAKYTTKDRPITMDGIGMKRPDWPTSLRSGIAYGYDDDMLYVGGPSNRRDNDENRYSIRDVDIPKLYEFIMRDDHVRLVIDTNSQKKGYTIIGDLFFVAELRRISSGWRREVSVMTKERLIYVSRLEVDKHGRSTLEINYPLGISSSGIITITNDDDIAEIKNWTLL